MTELIVDNRNIRVFISSTFQDMEAERSQLITKVFPILRSKAAKRGVTLTELDLRWGISQEESENGKVLEICLNEIDNSRPFFIGILGDRYGWCPDINELDKNHNIEERYPWSREYIEKGKSVTEIEMQYGALCSKLYHGENVDAYFWIKKGGDKSDERLNNLKESIRNSTTFPCSEYTNSEDLGRQVTEVFEALLDKRFPQKELDPMEYFKMEQTLYMQSHYRLFVPIPQNQTALDSFLQDDTQTHLLIIGEAGVGKSATLANWIKKQTDIDSSRIYLSCFLQAKSDGLCEDDILHYFSSELQKQLGVQASSFNEDPEDSFAKLYLEASRQKPVVMVLDGVNVMEDENEKLLSWLPDIPEKSKIIFSSVKDDLTFNVLTRRETPTISIAPLSQDEQEKFAQLYLAQYGKSLTDAQLHRIAGCQLSSSPMMLKAFLGDLKNYSTFNDLNDRIEAYSKKENASQLYQDILDNAETAFGADCIRTIFLAIAISQNGLKEELLKKMTNLSSLHWSQIFCSMSEHFFVHNGLISISSPMLRETIIKIYDYSTNKTRIQICNTIELNDSQDAVELSYQLWKLNEISRLRKFLSLDFQTFSFVIRYDKKNLFKYWDCIRSLGKSRKCFCFYPLNIFYISSLESYFNSLSEYNYRCLCSACFFAHVKETELTIFYCKKYIRISKCILWIMNFLSTDYRNEYQEFLRSICKCHALLSESYRLNGRPGKSIRTSKKILKFNKKHKISDAFSTSSALTNIADSQMVKGKIGKAVEIFEELLNISDDEENYDRVDILSHSIYPFLCIGELDKAKQCFEECERLCHNLYLTDPAWGNNYARILCQGSSIFQESEDIKRMILTALSIISEMRNDNYTIDSFCEICCKTILATTYSNEGSKEDAERILNDAINQLYEQINWVSINSDNKLYASTSYGNAITLYFLWGDYAKAKNLISDIYRKLPDIENQLGFGSIHIVYYIDGTIKLIEKQTPLRDSENLLSKSIAIFEQSNNQLLNRQIYLDANQNLAWCYLQEGKFKDAYNQYNKTIELYKKHHDFKDPSVQYLILTLESMKYRAECKFTKKRQSLLKFINNNIKELSTFNPSISPRYHVDMTIAQENIALFYIIAGDIEKVASAYEEIIQYAIKNGLDESSISTYQERYHSLCKN